MRSNEPQKPLSSTDLSLGLLHDGVPGCGVCDTRGCDGNTTVRLCRAPPQLSGSAVPMRHGHLKHT